MLSIGDLVNGRYSISKPPIIGDFGNIYQAIDVETKNVVAIKEIIPGNISSEQDNEFRDNLTREVDYLKLHTHENMVYFIDSFKDKDKFFYVTDWVEGVTLDVVLKNRKKLFKGREILKLFYALLNVVLYYNSQETAYHFRFLRPSDIIIDEKGHFKIVDVGISKDLMPEKNIPGYIDLGENFDEARDLYLIGSIIYEMVTGIKPAEKPQGTLLPPMKVNPDVPKSLSDIILLCVAPRKERYKMVRTAKHDLVRYFPEYSEEAAKTGEVPLEEQLREKELSIKLGNLSCLLIFLVMFAVFSGIYYFRTEIKKNYEIYKLRGCEQNLKNISVALELFKRDKGCYPASLQQLVPNYLNELPQCPATKNSDDYVASYQQINLGKSYYLYCKGRNHTEAGVKKDYPFFTSEKGLLEQTTDLKN